MLFMSIFTWDPMHTDEVIRRRMEEEIPEGIKYIDEWSDAGANRAFRLFEADDSKAILAASTYWNGIGYVDTFPVMKTDDILELLPGL